MKAPFENEDLKFANALPNGEFTKKLLKSKGIESKPIERRLIRLDSRTQIEAPKDLQPEDEAEFIRRKKIEFNIK